MTGVTILLVDDHPIVREGYRRLLERQPGFSVCAEVDNAQRAYQAYKDFKPDIVVMDIAMPGASGIEAVRHIRQWDKNARILIFSMHLGAAMTLKAFEAGALNFVRRAAPPGNSYTRSRRWHRVRAFCPKMCLKSLPRTGWRDCRISSMISVREKPRSSVCWRRGWRTKTSQNCLP